MSSDFAIRVQDLSKHYYIYARPEHRLMQSIMPKFQRLLRQPLTTYYTTYAALNGVSFEVRRRETIGLIGRNGSGKSTLVELMQGSLAPTSGTVETSGRVLALQLGSGFNNEFTGRDNIELNALVMGMDKAVLAKRMPSIIEFAGIGSFIDQPVKTYSSGMYSRLAFAVAAHLDADILLADEILAVGDMAFSLKCARFIDEFKSRGTLVLCAHDMGVIKQHCDRVLWMDAGRLRMVGPAKTVCDEYQRTVALEGDGKAEMKFGGRRIGAADPVAVEPPARRDSRADLIEASTLRNEIEVFDFDEAATWYGQRLASIRSVAIKDANGARRATLAGGEEVVIEIDATANGALKQPIIGFLVRNKSGLIIFSDNTYITYRKTPVSVRLGDSITARFRFQMPYLPAGEYAITCAIADGTQEHHVQQHWIDDAIMFFVASSHVAKGLCGIPMHEITLNAGSRTKISASMKLGNI